MFQWKPQLFVILVAVVLVAAVAGLSMSAFGGVGLTWGK